MCSRTKRIAGRRGHQMWGFIIIIPHIFGGMPALLAGFLLVVQIGADGEQRGAYSGHDG